MIIVSRTILSQPENATLVHLGENGQGYVYKTNDLEAVVGSNPLASVSVIPQSEYKELRKVLWSCVQINLDTQAKIRAKYSIEAELAALRTNDEEYRDFVNEVIAEHNTAKDELFFG